MLESCMKKMKMNSVREKREYLLTILFAVILFCVTFYLVVKQVNMQTTDYGAHSDAAIKLEFSNIFFKVREDTYILWHILVRLCWELIGNEMVNIGYAAGIVSGSFSVAAFVGTDLFISRFVKDGAAEMTFAVSLVGPLYMPWMNPKYYAGQGTPNTWHNPTNLAVKIFAIIIFGVICDLLQDTCQMKNATKVRKNVVNMKLFLVSVLLAVSVVAKPSFIMAFIPGLGLWMVIRCVIDKFKNVKVYFGICLLFIPAVLIMLYQYLTFFGKSSEAGIGIELFRGIKYYTNHPLISSLLALFFPLLFLILNFKREITRTDTQLAISYVSVAWLMNAFLYEKGPRESHGNMGWAFLIALYIFWMVTSAHFLQDLCGFDVIDRKEKCKQGVLFGFFAFHLILGCIYVGTLLFVEGIWF